jgi:hypothetical protein
MEVQARYLSQLSALALDLPVLCAGDVFDKWNVTPELINFALKHLPNFMIAVPGQHDLPNHQLDQVHRSGYGVLVEAGKIKDICGTYFNGNGFQVYGFGWNEKIGRPDPYEENDKGFQVALIHKFIWSDTTGYPGASEDSHFLAFSGKLKDYDVAVFGDNHKGFYKTTKSGTLVWNCGGFIRRRSDEINYRTRVGILMSDGTINLHNYDTSLDRFQEIPEKAEKVERDMREFLERMEKLGEHGLDFRDAVRRAANDPDQGVPENVRRIVLECLE